jgi:hypothetical protein
MRTQDFAWLAENSLELREKYAGKWIAVRDGEVIGVGDTAPEAVDEAETVAPNGDFILQGIDAEVDVIYGCL